MSFLLEITVTRVAGWLPNRTSVTLLKRWPWMVTFVPPEVGPVVVESLEILGAATDVERAREDVADVPLPAAGPLLGKTASIVSGSRATAKGAVSVTTPAAMSTPTTVPTRTRRPELRTDTTPSQRH